MIKFQRLFKKNILPLFYSGTLVGGTVLAYLSIKTTKNRKEWEEEQENDEFYKDMTRETNSYYGINWGFRADQLISDKIDAGDIFFIKYDCNECTRLKDIIRCTYLQFMNHEQDYDSIGFAFRDSRGLFIICNIFGQTKIIEYQEFLSQPFLKELSMRKLKLTRNSQEVQKYFYRNVRKHFKQIENSQDGVFQSSEQMAFDYMKAIEILKQDIANQDKFLPQVSAYDENNPFVLDKFCYFDSKVVIRSNTNRQLRRNE